MRSRRRTDVPEIDLDVMIRGLRDHIAEAEDVLRSMRRLQEWCRPPKIGVTREMVEKVPLPVSRYQGLALGPLLGHAFAVLTTVGRPMSIEELASAIEDAGFEPEGGSHFPKALDEALRTRRDLFHQTRELDWQLLAWNCRVADREAEEERNPPPAGSPFIGRKKR